MIFFRCATGVAAQAGCAVRARAKASEVSAAVWAGTSPMRDPVTGEVTVSVVMPPR